MAKLEENKHSSNTTKTDANIAEYIGLIRQLKYSFSNSIDIASKIVEQSKKVGLSGKEFRKSIVEQMDIIQVCGLTQMLSLMLKEFLLEQGDEKCGDDVNEIVIKCKDVCKKNGPAK
ncbi:hypothetical protein DYY65_07385 [Nitrososphaera sp. AFS]|nr:hypothetical protein [Nitrososphaera sp. AFS]